MNGSTKTAPRPKLRPTSVDIPEPLWLKTKYAAAEDRRSLRDFVLEGLEVVLSKRASRSNSTVSARGAEPVTKS